MIHVDSQVLSGQVCQEHQVGPGNHQGDSEMVHEGQGPTRKRSKGLGGRCEKYQSLQGQCDRKGQPYDGLAPRGFQHTPHAERQHNDEHRCSKADHKAEKHGRFPAEAAFGHAGPIGQKQENQSNQNEMPLYLKHISQHLAAIEDGGQDHGSGGAQRIRMQQVTAFGPVNKGIGEGLQHGADNREDERRGNRGEETCQQSGEPRHQMQITVIREQERSNPVYQLFPVKNHCILGIELRMKEGVRFAAYQDQKDEGEQGPEASRGVVQKLRAKGRLPGPGGLRDGHVSHNGTKRSS